MEVDSGGPWTKVVRGSVDSVIHRLDAIAVEAAEAVEAAGVSWFFCYNSSQRQCSQMFSANAAQLIHRESSKSVISAIQVDEFQILAILSILRTGHPSKSLLSQVHHSHLFLGLQTSFDVRVT